MNIVLSATTLIGNLATALAGDPQITSWFTVDSGHSAEIYRNDSDLHRSVAVTTWSNGRLAQSQPAYRGVQAIYSSADWIYIVSTGLGSHVMGPWYLDSQRQRLFPNLPTDQHFILRLPRHPVEQSVGGFNPLGEIGMFVDGVRMFDACDSFSYSNQDGRDADPRAGIGHGDHIWNRDAFVNEGITFDAALGHQQNWGRYHYHAEPLALRYLLGDHVDFDPATKTYHENKIAPAKHSPIIGWMQDGYPLYGPYGYADPKNPRSGIRRMISGFVARNGANSGDDVARTGRRTLPAWAVRERGGYGELNASEAGPAVNERYPIGHYIEDYAYLGDLGKTVGRDFDLDESNGRWCVTPEFPQGTYAYFTTVDSNGTPVYPYNMGRRYHGRPAGRLVNEISESVATNFVAHTGSPAKPATRTSVRLTWQNDPAGGTYQRVMR
jgi:hypothetical protein